jgi:transcriptional regulator with XRE-family HTH domain
MSQGAEEAPWLMDTWSNTCWHWRHRHRLTQAQAAAHVNVSLTTWSRWERGRTEPAAEEARRCHRLMEVHDRRLGPTLPPGIYKGDDAVTFIGGYRP